RVRCISGCVVHQHPLSSPTRRSSDLSAASHASTCGLISVSTNFATVRRRDSCSGVNCMWFLPRFTRYLLPVHGEKVARRAGRGRSEEHTSELQSREKLVCRLLLEKNN